MPPALRSIILVVVAAGLAGCASPRYQTVYRYEPPMDTGSRACLEECEQKMSGCQQRCTADFQACLERIGPEVEERYGEALRRYEAELDCYRSELVHYQFYLSMSWGHPHWYGPGFYSPWPDPYWFPPTPPKKPSRTEEFDRLQQEKCEADCGCQPVYDACFLACGGKRIPEVQCIANCPVEK